jgi:hypothetical protein
MFTARNGVLSGPDMGHTAGMARATHLHGRRNGWGTALLLGVLAVSTPCRAQEAYPAKSGAPMLVATTDSAENGLDMVQVKKLIAEVC